MELVAFTQRPNKLLSFLVAPGFDLIQHGLKLMLDHGGAFLAPTGVQRLQRSRIDENGDICVEPDINEIQKRLTFPEFEEF
jgi:hypothetical protein